MNAYSTVTHEGGCVLLKDASDFAGQLLRRVRLLHKSGQTLTREPFDGFRLGVTAAQDHFQVRRMPSKS